MNPSTSEVAGSMSPATTQPATQAGSQHVSIGDQLAAAGYTHDKQGLADHCTAHNIRKDGEILFTAGALDTWIWLRTGLTPAQQEFHDEEELFALAEVGEAHGSVVS